MPQHGHPADKSTWRYTLALDNGEKFKLKPANLAGLEIFEIAPLLNRRVETTGFGGSDGMRGLAVDFNRSQRMYLVKFDMGQMLTVPVANLRAEGAGGARGGAAGKAKKGKGKKGKGGRA